MKLFNKPTVNNKKQVHSERMLKRQYKKDALKRFEQIYKTSDSICKEWNKNAIPLITFREIIKKSKLSYTDQQKEQIPMLISLEKDVNQLMDTLVKSAQKDCKKMNSKELPLTILKEYKDVIIESFKVNLKG